MINPSGAAGGLDPRFKVAMIFFTGMLAVSLDNPASLGTVAAGGVLCALASRPSGRQLLTLFTILGLTVWALMVSQAIFYQHLPRTVILELIPPEMPLIGSLTGGVSAYYEGIHHGAVQSLRMVATLSVGLAAAWTTDPSRLLASFSALRLPHALAFGAAAAARFLPVTIEEARVALRAQRMRGLRLSGRYGLNALGASLTIARPVLAASIRRAETVALAAASRAYDPQEQRSSLTPLKMGTVEKAILLTTGLAAAFVAIAKVLYLLYAGGVYYHPALRALYTFTREVL